MWRACISVAQVVTQLCMVNKEYLPVGTFSAGEIGSLTSPIRPEAASSFLGLISTLVNVYPAQKGYWSITAKLTAGVNTALVAVMLIVLVYYSYQRTR